MNSTSIEIAYYLERYRAGDEETAFFGLIELEAAAVPDLIAAYRSEAEVSVKEFLVEVIWQFRLPSTISFLGEALRDPEPAIWKEALDGLVALRSAAALSELEAAKTSKVCTAGDADEFRSWLDEAIDQLAEQIKHD
jgi:hypothetical protein